MERVWIGITTAGSQERVTADSGPLPSIAPPAVHFVLRRMPGDVPAQWVKVHAPSGLPSGGKAGSPTEITLRVVIASNVFSPARTGDSIIRL